MSYDSLDMCELQISYLQFAQFCQHKLVVDLMGHSACIFHVRRVNLYMYYCSTFQGIQSLKTWLSIEVKLYQRFLEMFIKVFSFI